MPRYASGRAVAQRVFEHADATDGAADVKIACPVDHGDAG
jgi:hypothetical protein